MSPSIPSQPGHLAAKISCWHKSLGKLVKGLVKEGCLSKQGDAIEQISQALLSDLQSAFDTSPGANTKFVVCLAHDTEQAFEKLEELSAASKADLEKVNQARSELRKVMKLRKEALGRIQEAANAEKAAKAEAGKARKATRQAYAYLFNSPAIGLDSIARRELDGGSYESGYELHIRHLKNFGGQDDLVQELEFAKNIAEKLTNQHPARLVMQEINEKIKALEVGKCLAVPGGYENRANKGAGGHAVLYQIKRTSEDSFEFTVINTGDGYEHHSHKKDKSRFHDYVMEGLKLTDFVEGRFLICLMELATGEVPADTAKPLYDYLASKHPEGSHIKHNLSKGAWRKKQYRGNCYAKCVASYVKERLGEKLYHQVKYEGSKVERDNFAKNYARFAQAQSPVARSASPALGNSTGAAQADLETASLEVQLEKLNQAADEVLERRRKKIDADEVDSRTPLLGGRDQKSPGFIARFWAGIKNFFARLFGR